MLRELNELEYLSLAVGQPFNVVVMIRLLADVDEEKIAILMKKLQKRHPLLKARITFDERKKPWFTTEKVGEIPISIIKRESHTQALKEFHKQLTTPFDLSNENLPLIRVILLKSDEITDVVICSYHAISDGYSMVFLVRDMMKYWANENEKIIPLKFPTREVDIFTPKVRRMIPRTPVFAFFVLNGLRIYNFFRYLFTKNRKPAEINVKEEGLEVYSNKLSSEQTTKFLEKCKNEGLTVHSAVSTAFVSEHPIIGSPVNLRKRLNHDIGKSFGFYSSVAVYRKRYRKRLSFWENARKVQKKLLQSLKDRKLFFLQKVFNKTVSVEYLRKIGTYYVEIVTKKEPFSIDNLGLLDKYFQDIDQTKIPTIETFYGGITSFLDALIVLFYTLRDEMHFFYHYTKTKYSSAEIVAYAKKVKDRLINSLNSSKISLN